MSFQHFWILLYISYLVEHPIFYSTPSPYSKPTAYVMHCMWYSGVEELSLSVAEWFKIISDSALPFQEIYHRQLSAGDVTTMFRLRDMVRPICCVCVCLLKERSTTLFPSLKFTERQPCVQLMDQCVFYVVWRWSLFRGLTASLLSSRTRCNN
jgi:hypothetical protein